MIDWWHTRDVVQLLPNPFCFILQHQQTNNTPIIWNATLHCIAIVTELSFHLSFSSISVFPGYSNCYIKDILVISLRLLLGYVQCWFWLLTGDTLTIATVNNWKAHCNLFSKFNYSININIRTNTNYNLQQMPTIYNLKMKSIWKNGSFWNCFTMWNSFDWTQVTVFTNQCNDLLSNCFACHNKNLFFIV